MYYVKCTIFILTIFSGGPSVMIVFYLGSDSNQNAALDQETGPIIDSKMMKWGISTALKYCFTSGIFQMRNLAADKPSAAVRLDLIKMVSPH